ncbi:MAG: DUF6122 family protein [Adhaeribacter sp.]
MIHLLLHLIVPGLVSGLFYRSQWGRTWLILLSANLVDLDHLLADPIYDPGRCSIGYHLLHTYPAIGLYLLLLPFKPTRRFGIGLVIHLALDMLDCIF